MKLKRDDPRWAEPSNHRLIPGYKYYGKYVAVRGLIPEGASVLDVGCNCGQLAANLYKELGCEVTGVDLNDEYVDHCRKGKPGQFHALDFGTSLKGTPLAGKKFDVITCLEVLEHAINVRGFLRNFRAVMHKDSILIVTTPYPRARLGVVSKRHVRIWTEEELRDEFRAAGLKMWGYFVWRHEDGLGTHVATYERVRVRRRRGKKRGGGE